MNTSSSEVHLGDAAHTGSRLIGLSLAHDLESDLLLESARPVVCAIAVHAVVVGRERGPGTTEAVIKGVRLEPRWPHEDDLTRLLGATAVVAQAKGSLGSGQLDAREDGAPLLVDTAFDDCAGLSRTPSLALGGSPASGAAVAAALAKRQDHHAHDACRWVCSDHAASRALGRLVQVCLGVLARRGRRTGPPR